MPEKLEGGTPEEKEPQLSTSVKIRLLRYPIAQKTVAFQAVSYSRKTPFSVRRMT